MKSFNASLAGVRASGTGIGPLGEVCVLSCPELILGLLLAVIRVTNIGKKYQGDTEWKWWNFPMRQPQRALGSTATGLKPGFKPVRQPLIGTGIGERPGKGGLQADQELQRPGRL
jgi:hypothetical protein